MSPVDVIKYSFSGDGSLNRSFSSPAIIHKISGNLLTRHVKNWKDIRISGKTSPGRSYKGLRNYHAVREAIIALGNSIGASQWRGHKTLTLGGGHTQGIATIKVSALVLVARAAIDGKILVKNPTTIDKIKKLAAKGDMIALGDLITRLVQKRQVKKSDIEKITGNIAVIWLDSHPDYNDRHTTLSGNIHGMALAAATGRDLAGIENLFGGRYIKLNPANLYVTAARDIDSAERKLLDRDGVHYKSWELTEPGAMRTCTDPKHKTTLKKALARIFKEIGRKNVIFSMDVDAIHAGLHESPYGLEGVAATGTPMGLKPSDIRRLFGPSISRYFNHTGSLIRLNENRESPSGPSAGDVFEAVQDIIHRPNVLAADISEISPAAGDAGAPMPEEIRGLTLRTSMKVLAAMLGADLGKFSKSLARKEKEITAGVRRAVAYETKKLKRKAPR